MDYNLLNSAVTLYSGQELFEGINILLGLGLGTTGKNHIDSSTVHDQDLDFDRA
ncbi:MAG: hypothetical protein PVH64_05420 [Bacillota bacterium]|jgi:hypothetical protein